MNCKYSRLFAIAFLALLFSMGSAQNFTNGTVFNFSVGDSIMERHIPVNLAGGALPPSLKLRVVISKVICPTGDTIKYLEKRLTDTVIIRWNNSMPYAVYDSLVVDTVSSTITNLQSTAIKSVAYMATCQTVQATSYYDTCGIETYHQKIIQNQGSPCDEPPKLDRYYLKGVGVYQYTVSLKNPQNVGFHTYPVFIHKVGFPTCGSKLDLTTSLEKSEIRNTCRLLSNPAINYISVFSPAEGQFELLSLSGQKLLQWPCERGRNEVPVQQVKEGIYILILSSSNTVWRSKVILQKE